MITEQQRETRKSFLGSSDAPAIAGVDDYRQPADVYLEKIGEAPDREESESAYWGNVLEPHIASRWMWDTGFAIERDPPTKMHPDLPYIGCHADALVINGTGLEVKSREVYAADEYGPSGTDQVKDSDIIQCQHLMSCYGYDHWNMAVLIGKRDFRHYVIPRDEGLISDLLDMEAELWGFVLARKMPPIDHTHRSTEKLIKTLYPGTSGEEIVLPQSAIKIKDELELLSEVFKRDTKRKNALRAELALLMGDAAVGLLPGGGKVTRKEVRRKGYEVAATSYIDMRIKA